MIENEFESEVERLKSAMQVLDAADPALQPRLKLVPFDVYNAKYAIAETGQIFSAVNQKGKLTAVPRDIVDITGKVIYAGIHTDLHIPLRHRDFAGYHIFCEYRALMEAQLMQRRAEKSKWWTERAKIAKAFFDIREAKKSRRRCQTV